MIAAPACLLYTQDAELARRVRAYLRSITQLRHVQDPDRFDAVIEQTTPALLLLDLRAKESRELLDEVRNQWPDILLIALGTLRSEPLRDAEESGIYAAEDV